MRSSNSRTPATRFNATEGNLNPLDPKQKRPITPQHDVTQTSMEQLIHANSRHMKELQATSKIIQSRANSIQTRSQESRSKTTEPSAKREPPPRKTLLPVHSDKVGPRESRRTSGTPGTPTRQSKPCPESKSLQSPKTNQDTRSSEKKKKKKSDESTMTIQNATKSAGALEEMLVDFLVMYDIIEEEDNESDEDMKKPTKRLSHEDRKPTPKSAKEAAKEAAKETMNHSQSARTVTPNSLEDSGTKTTIIPTKVSDNEISKNVSIPRKKRGISTNKPSHEEKVEPIKNNRKNIDQRTIDAMYSQSIGGSQKDLIAYASDTLNKSTVTSSESRRRKDSSKKTVVSSKSRSSVLNQLSEKTNKQSSKPKKSTSHSVLPSVEEAIVRDDSTITLVQENVRIRKEVPPRKQSLPKKRSKTGVKKPKLETVKEIVKETERKAPPAKVSVVTREIEESITPRDAESQTLIEMIQSDYKKRWANFLKLTTKLGSDQEFVMRRYNELKTIHAELTSHNYEVKPVGNLVLVSLNKVRDYLIVGQLVNNAKCAIEHNGEMDELRDDVVYNVCIPNHMMILGDKFVERYTRDLNGYTEKAKEACRVTLEQLNDVLAWVGAISSKPDTSFNSDAVHNQLYSFLKGGRKAMEMFLKLQSDTTAYAVRAREEMECVIKQNQLLLQLETEVSKKLSDMKVFKEHAEIDHKETEMLVQHLKDATEELEAEKAMRIYVENSKEAFVTEMYKVRTDLRKIDEDYATLSKKGMKLKSEIRALDQKLFSKDVMTHSRLKDYEKMSKHAEDVIEKYKLRCTVLQETITDLINTRNERELDFQEEMEGISKEMQLAMEKMNNAEELKIHAENELKLSERYIKSTQLDLKKLIKLNDPAFKHPYPRKQFTATDREQEAWIALQHSKGQLESVKKTALRYKKERDLYASKVNNLKLCIKGDETPVNYCTDLVPIDTKISSCKLEEEIEALRKEVEASRQRESERVEELEVLKGVVSGLERGEEMAELALENTKMRRQIMKARKECDAAMEAKAVANAELMTTMFECSQRERVMSAQAKAFDARDDLINVINTRGCDKGDALVIIDSKTRIDTFEKIRKKMAGRERRSIQKTLEWNSVALCMKQLDDFHHVSQVQRVDNEHRIAALEAQLLFCECESRSDVKRLWDV